MKSIWKDIMIIQVYELSKSGNSETSMAKVLGISLPTFRLWETKKKLFKMAINRGRKVNKGRTNQAMTIQDHVFNRLSKSTRKTWRKLNRLQKEKKGFKKIEAMLESQGKCARQELFVYAWTSSNFNIAAALRKINISRSTFDLWRKTDKGFAQIVKEIDSYKKDFWENHLYQLGAAGSEGAILYANKTINQDIFPDPKKVIDVNLSGSVNVNVVCLADLNWPLKLKKQVLKTIRKYRKELSHETSEDES